MTIATTDVGSVTRRQGCVTRVDLRKIMLHFVTVKIWVDVNRHNIGVHPNASSE